MNQTSSVRLIANAGVLVEHGGLRLLVDGIHTNDNLEFDGLPADLLGSMLCGSGDLADLDYLLFTHEHLDHFSPGCTKTYLQNNRVREIFAPASGGRRLEELHQYARQAGVPCHGLQLAPGETQRFSLEEGIGAVAVGFRHMGAQFHSRENDCFLLELGDKTLLITGDADPDYDSFAAAFGQLHPDLVLVNPLFYLDEGGRRILAELLCPRQVAVYHLPYDDGRPSSYQKAVARDAEKRAPLDWELTLLTRRGQTILL